MSFAPPRRGPGGVSPKDFFNFFAKSTSFFWLDRVDQSEGAIWSLSEARGRDYGEEEPSE